MESSDTIFSSTSDLIGIILATGSPGGYIAVYVAVTDTEAVFIDSTFMEIIFKSASLIVPLPR